ncbi:MAG: hypothetical protein RLZZ148_2956, partial [Cyanobacteriota bacterium]
MSDGNNPRADLFLLPKLKDGESGLKADKSGEWSVRGVQTYLDIADSLDIESSNSQQTNVTSIPTVWARALFVQTALHTERHPLRPQVVLQWQGMLAAIALAEVRQFDLKVQLIELGKENHRTDLFARSLHS